jgi:magnesium transporter
MRKRLSKRKLKKLIEERNWNELREATSNWTPQKIADLLLDLDKSYRVLFFRSLPRQSSSEVFSYLAPEEQDILLEEMTDQETRQLFESLSPDDRTALLEELPAQVTKGLFGHLSPEDLNEARQLLGYPEESVGRLMTPDYVAVQPGWTIKQALEKIREKGKDSETINMIYVVDDSGKFLDDIRLRLLILANPADKVKQLMDYSFTSLSAFDDREQAVRQMKSSDLVALPVVDSDNILLGIVTFDDVLDVAEEETTEDIHKAASLSPLGMSYHNASIWTLYIKRIGWLVALVLMNLASTGIIAAYEETLTAAIGLALFIPLLLGSGGNTGSQSATLMIRALVTGDVKLSHWAKTLFKELGVGVLLGISLGLISWGLGLLRGNFQIGIIVGMTMIAIVLVANIIGMTLPFLLEKLKLDPAVASNPLMTTIADIAGLFIYFSIAAWILSM